MHFFNRIREVQFLKNRASSGKSELLVLYGRRRVGKSFLLEHTFPKALYFTADLTRPFFQMNRFLDLLKGPLDLPQSMSVDSWDSFFHFLHACIQKKPTPTVVIFDEFQYLPSQDPAFLSILQRWWDKSFSAQPLVMILCGSYIGMMEKTVLSPHSPIYGRRSGQYLIKPMDFFDVRSFVKHMPPEDQILVYACVGGIPLYLREFEGCQGFSEGLEQRILQPGQFLVDEGNYLTMEEFSSESSSYFDILRIVAQGRTRPNEIASLTGIPQKGLGTYLRRLLDVQLLRKETPFSLKRPRHTPLYFIDDDYLRFFFRFLFDGKDQIYRGNTSALQKKIKEQMPMFASVSFEKIAHEYIQRVIQPDRMGRWWKEKDEMDLVATKDNTLIVGEVKWTGKKLGPSILEELKRKTERLQADIGHSFDHIEYYLFSKNGFASPFPASEVRCMSLEDIVQTQMD